MFTKKRIGNPNKDSKGRFSESDYKRRIKKWTNTLIILIAIMVAQTAYIGAEMFNLMVKAVTPVITPVEAQKPLKASPMSLYDHICSASGGENCDVLYNLAKCESSLNKDAYNINTNGSVDLGLFQINSVHYGRTITASEALDVYASTRWTNEQIKKGNGKIWVCWSKI